MTQDIAKKKAMELVLLKFDGKDGPVFFVLEKDYSSRNLSECDADYQEQQRYFYEEHSCPTNWINNIVAVIENGDDDPHGFLEYVRTVPVQEQRAQDDALNFREIFPEAYIKSGDD